MPPWAGSTPSCDRRVVEVEERADAPQALARGIELAVEDGVDAERTGGRRQARELAGVRAGERTGAARKRPSLRRSPAARPCASGNATHSRAAWSPSSSQPRSGGTGQRVLVVDVERAAGGERGAVAADERGLELIDERVDHGSAGSPRRRRARRGRPRQESPGPGRWDGRIHPAHHPSSSPPDGRTPRSPPPRCSRPRRAAAAGCARPSRASSPASTARRIARAIATGSSAREIALAHSTASQPSSIASAASRRRADAGVEDHRHAGLLADQPQVVGVADAHARADRRAERHDRRAADVLEAAGEHRVVVRVGQDDEAVVDELLGGRQQLGRVGQQRALVADDLELDPVGLERLAGELRGEDRVARGVAAGGVGQQLRRRASSRTSTSEPRAAGVDPPQRDGDHLGAARRGSPRRASPGAGSRRCRGSGASANVRPAMRQRAVIRPAPPYDLDARAVARRERRPTAPRGTTSASTATATPRVAGSVELGEQRRRSWRRRQLGGSPLTEIMRAPPRSAGANASGRRGSPVSSSATSSAVTGRAGCRCGSGRWPRRAPSRGSAPTIGALSGVPGRSPATASSTSSSSTPGTSSAASRSSS